MKFVAVDADALASLSIGGSMLAQLSSEMLFRRAADFGLPMLSEHEHVRILLGALLVATGGKLHKDTWSEIREEARGLLLLAIKREGRISASTASALVVLNKPAVVEKYQKLGNRWTISEGSRDPQGAAIEVARQQLGGSDASSTAEWLRGLADALDEPTNDRPWWTSKPVLVVLVLTAVFVVIHILLLVRVLFKVHKADSSVLILPIAGLSASALVGAFAIGIHVMSGPSEKKKS